jgi:hypothetical protein
VRASAEDHVVTGESRHLRDAKTGLDRDEEKRVMRAVGLEVASSTEGLHFSK